MGSNLRYTLPSKHVKFLKNFKMTEAAAAPKVAKAKKPAKKAEHPPSAVMVLAAVKALKDKKGSSLPAIKKYIAANYKVDVVRFPPSSVRQSRNWLRARKSSKLRLASRLSRKRSPRKSRQRSPRQRKPPRKPPRQRPQRRQRRPPPKSPRPPRRLPPSPRPPRRPLKNPQRSPQQKRARKRQQKKPHPKRSKALKLYF